MKVASLLALVLILCIAFPPSIQPKNKQKKKPKPKKFCDGKDGNRYKVGEGYKDNKGKVCKHYKCVKNKNKLFMKKGKCSSSEAQIVQVTQSEIKFHSPGFPHSNYENNREYCWRFKAKNPQEKLSISFSSMQTEYGYDLITIYENASENKEKVLLITSGDAPPENIISHTNEIRIIFKTDVDHQMKGFEASVTSVIKKELPHFSWEKFSAGKIKVIFSKESSNPHHETIKVKLAPHFEGACVFQGSSKTKTTNLTIASPYSDNTCKSLSQHAQISMSSVHLDGLGRKATFSIKDGKLQETTEEIFADNEILSTPVARQGLQPPSHIEIRINLAYDRSILDKFNNFGSADSEIKKQLRQLFFFAKNHFEDLSGKTKIELLLKENIMLIDQVVKVKNTDIKNIRKFQIDNTEPIIVICGDFDEEILEDVFITGLSYRSGACRNDTERYGVGLVAWREDLARVGETLAHEIEHLFGMTHHGHKEHDITDWYQKQGRRCYTESCPSPPPRDNGKWICTKNNKMCTLKCSPGFASIISIIRCENGKHSINLEKAACSPSVFLLTGGYGGGRHMEVYHSTDATDKKVSCLNLPPLLQHLWKEHASVFFDGVLTLCGGRNTKYICSSLDMESENPQWLIYSTLPHISRAYAVISHNNLYLFDKMFSNLHVATLPLQETSKFTQDNKFKDNPREHCVAQLDEENVALLGGHSDGEVQRSSTKYNVKQQTKSVLPAMNGPRATHACIKVTINQIGWLVVSGGAERERLKTTERLNLDVGNTWENMNDLNEARFYHEMIWTKGNTIFVLGGYKYKGEFHNSIERLDWNTQSWQLMEQSLVKPNYDFSAVELPASLLGCKMNDQQACLDLPPINHGTWSCDSLNTKCSMKCDAGYVSTLTHTTCKGGVWSKVDRIKCQPSVWIMFQDKSHFFYHSELGHPTCSKPPPDTVDNWKDHSTFVHDNRLYNCGGWYTGTTCVSLNLEDDEFKWTRHSMDISQNYPSSVILENILYIVFKNNEPMSGPLPLADKSTFTPEPNITQLRSECVVSFVTLDQNGGVNKFNSTDKTLTPLSKLNPRPFVGPGCVVIEVEGTEWLVVSGGHDSSLRTARLDLSSDTATWEPLGDLNKGRYYHGMIVTSRGIMVLGSFLNTVEILSWPSQTWSFIKPKRVNGFYWRPVVEVPASTFGCQVIPINITECKGEYKYDHKYPGGKVKEVKDGETCHSVCQKMKSCKAWTWNAQGKQCRLHTTSGSSKFKNGFVSGLKESCKPNCYLLLENQNANISKQLCINETDCYLLLENQNANISKQLCINETDFEEKCEPLLQMAPDELQDNSKIFICYTVDEKSLCEEIEYKDVELLCNAEPSIVPLSTKKRINKHRFTRHLGSYFGKYG